MALFESMMTPCCIMNRSRVSDGQGGFTTEWTEGATIDVAIICDTSTAARVAQAEGVKNIYTLTTHKENALDFHEVIKRLEDGRIFRVTSDGMAKQSPALASFNMAQMSAEEWSLEQ